MIHGKPIENVSVIKGNVSALNGRPTWAFKFKLTLATLALSVCKPEGGRRSVTWLGAKEFSWPKVLSDGPEVTKQTGGLVEAQPGVLVTSQKKGSLVKPNLFQVKSDAQSSWVVGESLRGRSGDSESLVRAAMPELELCASALNADPVHVVSVVSPSVSLEGDNPDEAVSATEAPTGGFIGEVATSRGMGVEIQSPMAGISEEGYWQG